jgi:exopolyphosphatase/pppGpp-phosphohydrolase
MKIAIIDLGSNSFHMVAYSVERDGTFRSVARHAVVNALGRFLSSGKEMPPEVIRESVKSVVLLQKKASACGAKKVYAFGTGIFRRVSNATRLIDEIFKATGIVADVLSERAEARMIYTAIRHKYDFDEPSLIIDIGGGSSEFIYTSARSMNWYKSVPCGSALLLERVEKENANIHRCFIDSYGPVMRFLRAKKIAHVYGTAGFFRYALQWLQKAPPDRSRPVVLTRADIDRVHVLVTKKGFSKGSTRERALVRMGAEIMRRIMKRLALGAITVSETSTREGYLLYVLHHVHQAC